MSDLSVSQQIDNAKDGRTHRWIIDKMRELGIDINDVKFTNKKQKNEFTNEELKAISKILKTKITTED